MPGLALDHVVMSEPARAARAPATVLSVGAMSNSDIQVLGDGGGADTGVRLPWWCVRSRHAPRGGGGGVCAHRAARIALFEGGCMDCCVQQMGARLRGWESRGFLCPLNWALPAAHGLGVFLCGVVCIKHPVRCVPPPRSAAARRALPLGPAACCTCVTSA